MTKADDPYNLQRFVTAQDSVFEEACAELRAGQKTSHWIWFIFPQMRGLGSSEYANFYGIDSRGEAEAYTAHPVLGPRLRECARLVIGVKGRSIRQILGTPDDLKFRSSMTLFALISADNQIFKDALDKYFDGSMDERTVKLL